MPLCNEFIRRNYFSPSDHAAVYNMTVSIQETFTEIIQDNDCISDFTEFNALNKIQGMKLFVGYLDWVTDDSKIEEKFEEVDLQILQLLVTISLSKSINIHALWDISFGWATI